MRRREFLGTSMATGAALALPAVAMEVNPALTNREIAELFERACRGHLTNLLTRYKTRVDRKMFEREAEAIVDLEIGSLKRQKIETAIGWEPKVYGFVVKASVRSDSKEAAAFDWAVTNRGVSFIGSVIYSGRKA